MKAHSLQPLAIDFRRVVGRASTLDERLGGRFIPNGKPAGDGGVDARLDRWREAAAWGDAVLFAEGLARHGLDEAAARRALEPGDWPVGAPLPAWAGTLAAVMEAAAAGAGQDDPGARRAFDPQEPLPFEDLFLPFLHVARGRLAAEAGPAYDLLTAEAHAALERRLLRWLAFLCGQTLELEFSAYRAGRQSSLERLLAGTTAAPSTRLYQAFIDELLAGGLRDFFGEYSALARLAATAVDFWAAATAEFLGRLAADWRAIEQAFQPGAPLGPVIAINNTDLSDPHNHNRSVNIFTFQSGLRLVYKPKDLGMEAAYFRLLDWLNRHGAPLPFKILQVLERPGYGWVEFAAAAPCCDQAEAQRYFQRAGMLLCLNYLLQGTDFIYDNVIACGEQPVMIDLEACLQPWLLEAEDEAAADETVQPPLFDSVLRVGLLPAWNDAGNRGVAIDYGGLNDPGEWSGALRGRRWQHTNSDQMARLEGPIPPLQRDNLPALDGRTLSVQEYGAELRVGFAQMYGLLLAQRERLQAAGSPLMAFAHQTVRLILRATQGYFTVLIASLKPQHLRLGVERGIELKVLERALLSGAAGKRLWPALRVEQQALERGDIPYFTCRTDSDSLPLGPGQSIERCFQRPAFADVIARLERLSQDDLAGQLALIRGSLQVHGAHRAEDDRVTRRQGDTVKAPAIAQVTLSPDHRVTLSQAAQAIGEELAARALPHPDGGVTWLGVEYLLRADRYRVSPIGLDLYGGSSGVALFLAALGHVTGDARWGRLALEALRPLRKALQDPVPPAHHPLARYAGIGGAAGVGGILYTLVRAAGWLGEAALLADARRAAAQITPARIAADQTLDVIGGAAGAALGLLALYGATGEAEVLEQARRCGEHLLARRTVAPTGYRAWATMNGQLLTGFGHGAAGIAYALLRLAAVSGEARFRQAAEEAIAYERSVFDPQAGNWPDLRPNASNGEGPAFMHGWCSGAPGIGLARLGGLAALDTPEVRQEIEVALRAAQKGGKHSDHLCCGAMGRIEALVAGAGRLVRPEWAAGARRMAAGLAARAQAGNGFLLVTGPTGEVYHPGFFQGTAGIGYTLLRLAEPERLPSVLLWE